MENWFIPTQAGPLPPARRVWALAPHPDDEIFGPGGALRLYQAGGARVEVDILTDGTGYAQAHVEPAAAARGAEMAERRRAESRQALAVLGIGPPQCWGLPDRGLVQQVQAIASRLQARLQQASDDGQPIDVVFAPSLHEIHPDHNALIRATVRALLQLKATSAAVLPELLMYEVGAPLQPNLLVDISAVWADKRQAMQCFASQQARQDYARHVEGLNTYRSYYLGAEIRQAEAFRRIAPDALTQLDARLGDPLLGLGHPWHDEVLSVAQAQAEQLQDQLLAQTQLLAQAQTQLAQAQSLQQSQQTLAQTQQQALLERFDREMLEARNTLARQQQTLAELQWARDHGLAEKQALTRDLLTQQARYTQDVQQLQHDLARTQQDLARSQQDLLQLQQALQAATATAAQSQADLQAVHASWSWKLTAPLRRLRRLLG